MGTFHRITEVSYIQEVSPRDCEKTVELIRIEVTRSGHCNPGFQEARHAAECVFEGMASREGGCQAPQP